MGELKIYPLRSSSSGNAALISDGRHALAVDCGISGKLMDKCLGAAGFSPSEISAILVTHEHTDHIKGVGIFSRKYDIPVYLNRETYEAAKPTVGKLKPENIHIIDSGAFEIDGIGVQPFSIPHDAANPVGYTFESGGDKAAVATDMGEISETVFCAIKGSRRVLLESNYDSNMLDMGRYPYELKRRIRSSYGHLCNEDAASLAVRLVGCGTEEIILGHLSHENNYPALAYTVTKNALIDAGIKIGTDTYLSVARRDVTGCIAFDEQNAVVL